MDWMIFWLVSFSAVGPACTRRSRSFGSFFIRYRVIASADATEASVQRLLAAGAKTYLTKPLDVPLFMTVVVGALRERASPGVA